MDLGDFESSLKVLVVGSDGVGKTSLTSVFCRDEFPFQHKKTIGTEFREKNVVVGDSFEEVNLMIWEIGGEHIFAPNTSKYFKNTSVAIIMFSTSDKASFDKIEALLDKVKEECGKKTTILLIQNKVDLEKDASAISKSEIASLTERLGLKLFRISCKEKQTVDFVFQTIASKLSGSTVELADIGDVVPEIEEGSSPHMELSTPPLAEESVHREEDHLPLENAPCKSTMSDEPVSPTRSNNPLIFPRDVSQQNSPPTGPSKQRVTQKQRKGCACM